MHVFATHMQAWAYPEAIKVRSEQAFIIDRFIREQKIPANEPVFVAGDLNVDYYVPAQYRSLVLGGLKCNNPFERELERMRTRNDHNSLRHTCDFERNEFMKFLRIQVTTAPNFVSKLIPIAVNLIWNFLFEQGGNKIVKSR